tara:strand:+ start:185 stop:643 length:459 start_codon:yes stop_codon:yes gene_type:complete
MGDTHKPNEEATYNSPKHGLQKLKFLAVVDPNNKKGKYLVASRGENEHKIRLHRLPSLNLKTHEQAQEIMEKDLKEQKALENAEAIKEIKKMAKEMGILDSDGEFKIGRHKIFGGRRTRRRKRKRRRKSTKKKRRRRRTKKKRRRRRRRTRK